MSGFNWSCAFYLLILYMKLHNIKAMGNRQEGSSTDQICNETNADLVIVDSCPKNTTSFQKRSGEKMCGTKPKCLGETLVYHCVRSKENLVEVCAPSSPIIGSCCTIFDRGVWRVIEDYSRPCEECPFKYQSSFCYNYSTCVETKENYRTSPSSDHETTSSSLSNDEGSNHNFDDRTEHSSEKIITIVISTLATTIFALGCLAIIFHCRRHKKGLILKEKHKDFKEVSSCEKGYPEGINDHLLIVNGNINIEPS